MPPRTLRPVRALPPQPVDAGWRPFCSERCKLLDLARWVDGEYRIAGRPGAPDARRSGRARPTNPDRSIVDPAHPRMPDTLTITDNRTGKAYELPIQDGTIRATDLGDQGRRGRLRPDDYDPAFVNTAACRSAITYIDGDKGILRYRGYPIEQLAEHSRSRDGLAAPRGRAADRRRSCDGLQEDHPRHTHAARAHREVHGRACRRTPHPMGVLPRHRRRAVDVLSGGASNVVDAEVRRRQIHRIDRARRRPWRRTPYRHSSGRPYVYPANGPELRRQFPEHAVQDDAGLKLSRRIRCWNARSTSCSSCTPITSRTARTFAMRASAARRPIRTRRWPARRRRSTARCTAAPTKPCSGCSRDRLGRQRARVHQAR